jgi:hypothetical protein
MEGGASRGFDLLRYCLCRVVQERGVRPRPLVCVRWCACVRACTRELRLLLLSMLLLRSCHKHNSVNILAKHAPDPKTFSYTIPDGAVAAAAARTGGHSEQLPEPTLRPSSLPSAARARAPGVASRAAAATLTAAPTSAIGPLPRTPHPQPPVHSPASTWSESSEKSPSLAVVQHDRSPPGAANLPPRRRCCRQARLLQPGLAAAHPTGRTMQTLDSQALHQQIQLGLWGTRRRAWWVPAAAVTQQTPNKNEPRRCTSLRGSEHAAAAPGKILVYIQITRTPHCAWRHPLTIPLSRVGGTYLSRTQKLFSKVSRAKMVGYRAMKHVSFSRQLPFLSFLLSFCSDTPDILTIAAQASLICPHDDAAVASQQSIRQPLRVDWLV